MLHKIIFTGNRDWEDEALVFKALLEVYQRFGRFILIHGRARGLDSIADKLCRYEHPYLVTDIIAMPVDNKLDGKWPAAGHRRNERMFLTHWPIRLCVGFPMPHGSGTQGCMKFARNLRVETWNYVTGEREGVWIEIERSS